MRFLVTCTLFFVAVLTLPCAAQFSDYFPPTSGPGSELTSLRVAYRDAAASRQACQQASENIEPQAATYCAKAMKDEADFKSLCAKHQGKNLPGVQALCEPGNP
jgi:hypothetical protein